MPPCPDCTATREAPQWPRHCPTCLWCGARILRRILNLKGVRTKQELSARASLALQVWVAHGHSESQLRTLCADGCLIQPLSGAQPVDEPTKTKPAKKRK